jgi:hypothetical protein
MEHNLGVHVGSRAVDVHWALVLLHGVSNISQGVGPQRVQNIVDSKRY